MKVQRVDFKNAVTLPPSRTGTTRVTAKNKDIKIELTKRLVKVDEVIVPFENVAAIILENDGKGNTE